jgi:hypothetical protein
MRKHASCFTGLALLALAISASGQETVSDALEDENFSKSRARLQAAREAIIREEFRFTERQEKEFWPVYDEYRAEISLLRDRQAEIVMAYLKAYRDGTVSEEQAEQFIDDYLDFKSDLLKLQKKHLRQFRKVLPPRMVARFYQLENKLDAELEAQLALYVPLMDPV